MRFEPGSFYIMDRGYVDFARLYVLASVRRFFIIRAKREYGLSPASTRN